MTGLPKKISDYAYEAFGSHKFGENDFHPPEVELWRLCREWYVDLRKNRICASAAEEALYRFVESACQETGVRSENRAVPKPLQTLNEALATWHGKLQQPDESRSPKKKKLSGGARSRSKKNNSPAKSTSMPDVTP